MLKKIFLLVLFTFTVSLLPLDAGLQTPQVKAVNQVPSQNIDSGSFMFNLTPIVHQGVEGSVKQGWIRRGLDYFFEKIIGFMAGVIGTLCVLMLSIGGFLMIISAGNEARYEQGKNYVIYSLIGLAATLGAYILVTLVQLLIRSVYG